MSLAEDADKARAEVEQYRANLELLVQQRTDELRASEQRSRLILDTAPVSIAFSTKGRVHFANPLLRETFGAKVGDASPQLYPHPEERKVLIERMKRDGIARDHEIQMYDRHKRVRDMLVTFLPISDEGRGGCSRLADGHHRAQAGGNRTEGENGRVGAVQSADHQPRGKDDSAQGGNQYPSGAGWAGRRSIRSLKNNRIIEERRMPCSRKKETRRCLTGA